MKVSRAVFAKLVEEALEELPDQFAACLTDIVIDVEDLPDQRTIESVGLTDRRELLGLYHGVPLTDRSVEAPVRLPDRITVYQANIQRVCRNRDQLVAQIRKTVLHEIGHYFGLDEDELDALGYG